MFCKISVMQQNKSVQKQIILLYTPAPSISFFAVNYNIPIEILEAFKVVQLELPMSQ